MGENGSASVCAPPLPTRTLPITRAFLASLSIYAVAAALMGRDVLTAVTTHISGDVGDPVLNASILTWNARTLPWTDAWFQFPGFYPARDALTFSEHLLGVSVVFSPLYWLSGEPVGSYNLTLLFGYVLSGGAMYALAWRLTRHGAASFLAGLAFAFAPYRVAQIAHIQVGFAFWAPLALLGLHAYLESGRRRWLALFAAAWMLQGAANGYFLVFFSVLVALWVAWFVIAARRWRDLALISAAAAIGAVPLVPILLRFASAHAHYGFSRPPEEIAGFGADVAGLGCASGGSTLWSGLQVACRAEGELFPGVTALAVCAAGAAAAIARKRFPADSPRSASVASFYVVAALITWALAWGPRPSLHGEPFLPYGPYSLLQLLPGMDSLRVPSRFWMMTVMCLSVLTALGAAALLRGRHRTATAVVVVVAATGLLADGWTTIPAAAILPPPPDPESMRGGTALTLPLGDNRDVDIIAQFRAVEGGWSSVNGFSGYEPFHYGRFRQASREADPFALVWLRTRGDLDVIVREQDSALARLVETQPGARLIGANAAWQQYRLPSRGRPVPSAPTGERLPIVSLDASCSPEMLPLTTDGDAASRWHCGPQMPGQELIVDLGTVRQVGTVIPSLGNFASDQPKQLLVETSVDGSTWVEAWNHGVRAEAFDAEIRDPLDVRILVAFAPRQARYVRLRQTARDDTWYWSIAEVEVWSGGSPPS